VISGKNNHSRFKDKRGVEGGGDRKRGKCGGIGKKNLGQKEQWLEAGTIDKRRGGGGTRELDTKEERL